MLGYIFALLSWRTVGIALSVAVALWIHKMLYELTFSPLKHVPGPWYTGATSLWIRWQRWNGRLSFQADELLTKYGPIVRISPNLVLVNDKETVERIFNRKDLDTSPTAIRALRVGGHDWTVTYPQHPIARARRHPVMIATTTKNMKVWHDTFMRNIENMISDIGKFGGLQSEDIVRHLRIATLRNSEIIMGGSKTQLEANGFPEVVGAYNFLVIWRLCLPEWMFLWLQHSPFNLARFRVQSSDKLYDLGEELVRQAEEQATNDDLAPSVYQLFTDPDAKYPVQQAWTRSELGAEMAGQILAATETTSSALAYIFYELAKNQELQAKLREELCAYEGYHDLDQLKLLDACIREGLRYRPPVALTGSRAVPQGGLEVCGYYLPEGTVLTTQALSMSRQRKDLFADYDVYNPLRSEDDDKESERRRLWVPFGVGSRKCPGGNMAMYQMRLILAASLREFVVTVAPETTPDMMEPFEANGYRSRHDRCDLIFTPTY